MIEEALQYCISLTEISDNSYAVIFRLSINNLSIPANIQLRNETYQQLQSTINTAVRAHHH